MLRVAIVRVGAGWANGACWASGVGDEEISGVSVEGEEDVVVVEEVGE